MTTSAKAVGDMGLLDAFTPDELTAAKKNKLSFGGQEMAWTIGFGMIIGGPVGALIGYAAGKTLLGLGIGAALGALGGVATATMVNQELDAELP